MSNLFLSTIFVLKKEGNKDVNLWLGTVYPRGSIDLVELAIWQEIDYNGPKWEKFRGTPQEEKVGLEQLVVIMAII